MVMVKNDSPVRKQNVMTTKIKALLFSTTTLASLFAGTLPAQADSVLTFVRETTGNLRPERPQRADENTPQPAPMPTEAKQTVTVQIKGAVARVEFRPIGAKPDSAPSRVLLYDGMVQKIYTLDMAGKTYFWQSYKEAIDGEPRQGANTSGGFASNMTFTATAGLTAARANNAFVSKEILGVKTRQYVVSGNVEMKLNMPQGGSPAVSRPSTGGFPVSNTTVTVIDGRQGRRQGGPGGQGRAFPTFTPPSLAVEGEIWSTDGIALFTAGRDTPIAAIYRLMLPDDAGPFGTPLTKPLVTRLKNMKSLPGESTISYRMNMNFPARANTGDAPTVAPLTTRLLMTEMKTDATLEDTLFAIPTDFKEAQPPAVDLGRPGANGNRRGSGGDGSGRRFGGNQVNE